ncbi:unnamed protein product [Rodentolepis nana]|uniref:AMP_N domain-containing protein n=1 Tax=Rodentolepis nana TaxID=102285 RepID=A0A0R3TTD7_RODNA|nr:unnamed protein product [Rodentolepis nana]
MANAPRRPQDELEECHPKASPPLPLLIMNIPKQTDQQLVFITVGGISPPYREVKNYIFKKTHLIETSGGRLHGMGVAEETHSCGCQLKQANIITLICSNYYNAWGIFEALRLNYEFPHDVDYFIVDLCNFPGNATEYPLMEISLYEVRNIPRFNELYVSELPALVRDHNGHLIAGTSEIGMTMGTLKYKYCTISQWKRKADYHVYCERGKWF